MAAATTAAVHVSAASVVWIVFAASSSSLLVLVLFRPDWISSPPPPDTAAGQLSSSSRTPITHELGPWRMCVTTDLLVVRLRDCKMLLGSSQPSPLPWAVAAVLFTAAALLAVAGAASALSSLCFQSCLCETRSVFTITGIIYGCTGLCMVMGITLFCAGWAHESVRSICGMRAMMFIPGDCSIKWPLMCAVGLVFAALLLALTAPYVESYTSSHSLPCTANNQPIAKQGDAFHVKCTMSTGQIRTIPNMSHQDGKSSTQYATLEAVQGTQPSSAMHPVRFKSNSFPTDDV